MPAPSHLVDSLGRCGVSFVVIAFYVLIAVATIVGVVGPATLVTWPNVYQPGQQSCAAVNAMTCNIEQTMTISGLAPYNQLVAVMAQVNLPRLDTPTNPADSVKKNEYIGYDQTYTLKAEGRDSSGALFLLSNRNHTTYLEFDSDPAIKSSPSFVLAYYPQ